MHAQRVSEAWGFSPIHATEGASLLRSFGSGGCGGGCIDLFICAAMGCSAQKRPPCTAIEPKATDRKRSQGRSVMRVEFRETKWDAKLLERVRKDEETR